MCYVFYTRLDVGDFLEIQDMKARKRKTKTSMKRRLTKSGRKIIQTLNQAKRSEKLALKKLGMITRQNKMLIEKMRKTIKAKVAEKVRQAAKSRKLLMKKHASMMKKLRKEHALAMKKLRKMKGNVTTFKRKTKSKKGTLVSKAMTKRRKIGAKKTFSSRRRRSSRARLRRAA